MGGRKLWSYQGGIELSTKNQYRFDKQAGDRAVKFIESYCTHVKGKWAGKPFKLEKWQKDIVRKIFGWKRKDGTRRYRTVLLLLPRKNGKTLLLSAIALYMQIADNEPGAEIYTAAGDRYQSGISFDICKQMIRNSSRLSKALQIYQHSIYHEKSGSSFKALSREAGTKHGLNAHFVGADELHVWPDRELYDALVTSVGAREQPLVMAISTAGTSKQSLLGELYERGRRIIDGAVSEWDDSEFLPIIYEADEDDDPFDPATWKKANPNLDISISKSYIQKAAEEAKRNPAALNSFLRLHLNVWTQSESRFIPEGDWLSCEDDLPDLKGLPAWGGLDLSSTRDLSAFALVWKGENQFYVRSWYWLPDDAMHDRVTKDGVPYNSWIRDGFISTTPGRSVNYAFIRAQINKLSEEYNIQEIAFDRWNANQLTNELSQDGAELVQFGQGFASMSGPIKELEKLIYSERIMFEKNPVLRWMNANVQTVQDPAGNIKFDKSKSREKIDGMIALVMALSLAITGKEQEQDESIRLKKRGGLITI